MAEWQAGKDEIMQRRKAAMAAKNDAKKRLDTRKGVRSHVY